MEALSIDDAVTKRFALLVTTLAAFLSPFGISSVNIALPSIGKEFLMDAILLSWVTTAYLLASAMFLVPFGKIADIYGRKRIFTYGILTFTLASVGSAISNSAVMLICFRILQGIGAAAIYCVGAAILTSVFPSRELGKVLGINVAAVYLGIFSWAIFRRISNATSWVEKYFSCQCVSGIDHHCFHFLEIERRMARGKGGEI